MFLEGWKREKVGILYLDLYVYRIRNVSSKIFKKWKKLCVEIVYSGISESGYRIHPSKLSERKRIKSNIKRKKNVKIKVILNMLDEEIWKVTNTSHFSALKSRLRKTFFLFTSKANIILSALLKLVGRCIKFTWRYRAKTKAFSAGKTNKSASPSRDHYSNLSAKKSQDRQGYRRNSTHKTELMSKAISP